MAFGNEVILGWSVEEFCKVFGLKMPKNSDFEDGSDYQKFEEAVSNLIDESKLEQAHKAALIKSKIVTNLKKPTQYPYDDGRHTEGTTKKGQRIFAHLSLEITGDEGELGDIYPDTFVVGISISSRYVPTYLDWQDENGTIDTICIDDQSKLIKIIKDELEKIEPKFKTAKLFVKLCFY